jgi:predicted TIM-barrel fold metal-dependent hydrolase
MTRTSWTLCASGRIAALLFVTAVCATNAASQQRFSAARVPYIDVHAHLDVSDIDASMRAVRDAPKSQDVARIVFMPPPFTTTDAARYDCEAIQAVSKQFPDTLSFLGGGGTLNVMIQDAVRTGDVGAEVRRLFTARAEEILRQGALGFGELTAEHFAGATPYQYAPVDHPLFLLLADIAADHDVVIDLHVEAVPRATNLPADLPSPPNPPTLHDNIAALERFLDHNRRARIGWAHAGSDGTGARNPQLARRLLRAHPNLFMELKLDPSNRGRNYPLGKDGRIDPAWLELLHEFPDRFVVGSDQHYPPPAATGQRWEAAVHLLNQLPDALARKIGYENAVALYHLPPPTDAARRP